MDGQHRQASGRFRLHIGRARNGFQQFLNLPTQGQQRILVVAEHLDRHIRPHPGQQLVKTHLDRLGKFIIIARHFFYRTLHRFHQLRFAAKLFTPFRLWLEDHKIVRNARRHRVGGDLRRTDLGENFIHLGEGLDLRFQYFLHFNRSAQTGAGNAQRMQRNITLIQTGHKFAAHARRQQTGQRQRHHRDGHGQALVMQGGVECRDISFFRPSHGAIFFFRH